jgi:hypothetical protein
MLVEAKRHKDGKRTGISIGIQQRDDFPFVILIDMRVQRDLLLFTTPPGNYEDESEDNRLEY